MELGVGLPTSGPTASPGGHRPGRRGRRAHQPGSGTSVLDTLFHSPVVLARRLATLDRLSGGRLLVGLGQG